MLRLDACGVGTLLRVVTTLALAARALSRLALEHLVMGKAMLLAALSALALVGCASYSEKIAPAYVSLLMYEPLNCRQLAEEAGRISQRVAVAAGVQDSQASKDTAVTVVSAVIFWPALFFVSGDNAKTAELARLKGEMEAIEQASIRKNCGIQFRAASPS
jgi:hypothetical protein